jgi:hypothetical protein
MSASALLFTPTRHRTRLRAWLQSLLVAAVAALTLPACGNEDSPAACPGITADSCPDPVPSYAEEIAPLLERRCQTCHTPGNDSGLWSLGDHESAAEWTETTLRVIRNCSQPPPDSGVYLTSSERRALEAWLVCGAPDN